MKSTVKKHKKSNRKAVKSTPYFLQNWFAPLCTALAVLLLLVIVSLALKVPVFTHSPYDSYTRQALAWREGSLHLLGDQKSLEYLELAHYEGELYVSFPPVPSLFEFPLTFFFGANTPDRLLNYLYISLAVFCLAFMFKRRHSTLFSVVFAVLCTAATNLPGMLAFGGVWHEAQCLAFLFCSAAVCLIDAKEKHWWGVALFCAAMAVGCRPFTVIFIPVLLAILIQRLLQNGEKFYAVWPYLIAPACVAFGLMAYNYVRFADPFEFGHNYLPEFLREENGQFHYSYLGKNLWQSFKLPFRWEDGIKIDFNQFEANCFWLVNPAIGLFCFYNLVKTFLKGKEHFIYFVLFLAFVVVTCLHRTLGGFQFGARYFVDMIPYLAFYMNNNVKKLHGVHFVLALFGLCLNLYGISCVV